MARGIIYVMTTVVPGLIKIGKTGTDNFDSRMYHLERNGYSNVAGLKREFAIEVDNYDEKEKLLDDIFSKSRVPNTELFALDVEVVKSLLSSLDGKQVYPSDKTKKEVFVEATKEMELKVVDARFLSEIPDGEYTLKRNVKGFGEVNGKAVMKEGVFTVLKGSYCANVGKGFVPSIRRNAPIVNNILQKDIECLSPSSAGWVVIGKSNNGWSVWKDKFNRPIDYYRNKQ